MYLLGHIGISLLLFSPLAALLVSTGQVVLAVLTGALMVALGPFPDLDEYTDRIPHRGPTHTVWFALGVGMGVGLVAFAVSVLLGIGATGGNTLVIASDPLGTALWFGGVSTLAIFGHLAGDIITPMGVWPFRPISTFHHSFAVIPAKNPRANYTLFVAGVGAVSVAVAVATFV